MSFRVIFACVVILSMTDPAAAHHSSAAYEPAPIVLKSGTFKSLVWANPHTILTFDVKDEKGTVASWNIESGSPSALTRMGWTRNSLKAGDEVSLEVFPARNGAKVGRLARVILPDGKELRDSQGTEGSVGKPVQ